MPEFLETLLRGGAVTTFLLLAVVLLRDGRDRTLARLGALFCVSIGLWALHTPPFVPWSFSWAMPIWIVSHGKYAAFWLFSRAIFDDGFRMKPLDWAVWAGMVVLGSLWHFGAYLGLQTGWLSLPRHFANLVLAAAAAWVALKGRRGDLVEPRRRVRVAYVLVSSVLIIGVTAVYIAPGDPPAFAGELNVVRLFVMAVGLTFLVFGLRSQEMFGATEQESRPARGVSDGSVACADTNEARLLTRLLRLMEEERVYRLEGLSIGALAARMDAPEYALRRLINGRLGYRNFNAYLNGWRLADAKAALADPSQRDVPISTIALDAGFSSLGPFNRAFKAEEGATPSEYRDGRRASDAHPTRSPISESA